MRRLIVLLAASSSVMFGQAYNAIRSNYINCSVSVGIYVGQTPGDIGAQINAAQTATPPVPCLATSEIVIAAGTWAFSTPIVITTQVTLRGQGNNSVLAWGGSTAGVPMTVSAGTANGNIVILKDFVLASSVAGVVKGISWVGAGRLSGLSGVGVGSALAPNNHGFLTGISIPSGFSNGFMDHVTVAVNPANDILSSPVGVNIATNVSAVFIYDLFVRDTSAGSAGSICLEVNSAQGVNIFGGRLTGCTVGLAVGTNSITNNLVSHGMGFTGSAFAGSSVDVEIGSQSQGTQLIGSVMTGATGQVYLAQIDSGSLGTVIDGPVFLTYTTCGINNLASSSATTWAMEDAQANGACIVNSIVGLTRNLNSLQNYFSSLFTIGINQFSSLTTGIAHLGPTGIFSSSPVNLASADVSGILPAANGGTGAATTSQSFALIGPVSGSGPLSLRLLVATDIPTTLAGMTLTGATLVSGPGTTGSGNKPFHIKDTSTNDSPGINLFDHTGTQEAVWTSSPTVSMEVVNSSGTNDLVVFQNGGPRFPHVPTGTSGGTQACWDGSFNLSSGTCGGGVTSINGTLTGAVTNVAITNVANTFTAVVEFSTAGTVTSGQIYLVDTGTTITGMTLFNGGGSTRIADWNAGAAFSFEVVNSSGTNDLVVFQNGTLRIPHITASGSGGTAVCVDGSGNLYKAPC